MPDNTSKRCATCKLHYPVTAFLTPRMRECLTCSPVRLEPQPKRPLAATSTRIGWNRYMRERKRRAALAAYATATDKPLQRAHGPERTCPSCHEVKPASAFPSDRWRLCASCEQRTR
jgi:hypothetical protein